ncbi:unknown [Haloarcula marismortui ATCC 43049]|uniref:UspA domain-containing protein n=4 Tax=Haloarcula TaxID=2237 RepID=Q5V099_HALMA|nr:unknown [Haloarcula marismortui ATCC 43049]
MTTVSNIHHASKPRLNTLLVTARDSPYDTTLPARTPVDFCRPGSQWRVMDIDLVLAPVDGSDQSERAAEYAIAVAERYDADLHLLFVIDERLHQDIDSGDVSATAIAEEHQAFTESIRDRFRDAHDGVFETSSATAFSETRLMQTPGSVVLDVAEDLDSDFIVVPREEGSEEAVGRAAIYVIEYASQPVLTV